MESSDYLQAGLILLKMAGPFLIITLSIFYAGEITDLIKKAVLSRGGRGGY